MSENLKFAITFVLPLKQKTLILERHELALLMAKLRQRQMKGVDELNLWTAGKSPANCLCPGTHHPFFEQAVSIHTRLLCVNVGASATSVAAGFNGELMLGVYPQYGLGENLAGLLQ